MKRKLPIRKDGLKRKGKVTISAQRLAFRELFWIPLRSRLLQACKRTGQQTLIARLVGVHNSQIHRYTCPVCEHDQEPSFSTAMAIMVVLNQIEAPHAFIPSRTTGRCDGCIYPENHAIHLQACNGIKTCTIKMASTTSYPYKLVLYDGTKKIRTHDLKHMDQVIAIACTWCQTGEVLRPLNELRCKDEQGRRSYQR